MKIAILNGSPKVGNTAAMVNAFAEGAKEAGQDGRDPRFRESSVRTDTLPAAEGGRQPLEVKMKTAILYYSSHHGNTKKLAEAIAAADPEVQLFDVTQGVSADLSSYDLIGIASGIYAGNFGKPILRAVEEKVPENKRVFLLYTSAMPGGGHTKSVRKALDGRRCTVVGEFSCRGYNTFGPFKLVGGTSKGHPTEEDLANAVSFYRTLS